MVENKKTIRKFGDYMFPGMNFNMREQVKEKYLG